MKNIKKKILLRIFIIALGIFVIPPSIFVFLSDPCHIFHKPYDGIFQHGFTDFSICQNAGLIKTYLSDSQEGYDSLLTGTSLSGNFLTRKIAAMTPWRKTMKITMPSAAPSLIQLHVELSINTGNIHHVFWEIFPFKFLPYRILDEKTIASEFGDFPGYLYNTSRLDDYRYIFNYTILGASLGVVYGEDYYNIKSIDDINFWKHSCNSAKECQPFHDDNSLQEINSSYRHPNHALRSAAEISAINYAAADRYVLRTILPYCNSSKSFDIFFPPISMLWHSTQSDSDFDFQLYLLRYLVTQTASCRNVRVFAFDNEEWITGDLAHYHDHIHVFGDVQDYMLRSFGTGKHIITPENIDSYERTFIERVNNYTPWASTADEMHNQTH